MEHSQSRLLSTILKNFCGKCASIPVDLLNDGDLVHVEQQPGQVADGEHGHDQHQHHGHAVLLASPPLPPPPDT